MPASSTRPHRTGSGDDGGGNGGEDGSGGDEDGKDPGMRSDAVLHASLPCPRSLAVRRLCLFRVRV